MGLEDYRLFHSFTIISDDGFFSDFTEECAGRTGKGDTVTGATEGRSRECKEGDAGQLAGGMSISLEVYDWGTRVCLSKSIYLYKLNDIHIQFVVGGKQLTFGNYSFFLLTVFPESQLHVYSQQESQCPADKLNSML